MGVIVALDIYPTRWLMLLDDSSGATLEITCGRPKLAHENVDRERPLETSKTPRVAELPVEGLTATGRSIDLRAVDIGTVVKVKGGVGKFRGEKQLLLEKISILHTTNEEAAAWAENTAFRREILDTPWTLSKKDEEQARKKAEGLDYKQKKRERRRSNPQTDSRVQKGPSHKLIRRGDAQQENENNQRADDTALAKKAMKHRQVKRNEEKLLRQEEFKKLKTQQKSEKVDGIGTQANGEEQIYSVLAANHNDDLAQACELRVPTLSEKTEQAKLRRAEERQLRELEFQKAKGTNVDKRAVTTLIAERH